MTMSLLLSLEVLLLWAHRTGTSYLSPKESILEEWILSLKLCTDFTLKHRWRPKIKKLFLH